MRDARHGGIAADGKQNAQESPRTDNEERAAASAQDGAPGALTLAQFLKAAELAASGGQAKHLVRAGGITVNGVEETRPGRKLVPGDVVGLAGERYEIT